MQEAQITDIFLDKLRKIHCFLFLRREGNGAAYLVNVGFCIGRISRSNHVSLGHAHPIVSNLNFHLIVMVRSSVGCTCVPVTITIATGHNVNEAVSKHPDALKHGVLIVIGSLSQSDLCYNILIICNKYVYYQRQIYTLLYCQISRLVAITNFTSISTHCVIRSVLVWPTSLYD